MHAWRGRVAGITKGGVMPAIAGARRTRIHYPCEANLLKGELCQCEMRLRRS